MSGKHRKGRRIRTMERSPLHPKGRPLPCSYHPCGYLAERGFEREIDGIMFPFCSQDHSRNFRDDQVRRWQA